MIMTSSVCSTTLRMQPVHVTDVAAAIVSAVKDDGSSIGKTFELGGPDVYTVNELVRISPSKL